MEQRQGVLPVENVLEDVNGIPAQKISLNCKKDNSLHKTSIESKQSQYFEDKSPGLFNSMLNTAYDIGSNVVGAFKGAVEHGLQDTSHEPYEPEPYEPEPEIESSSQSFSTDSIYDYDEKIPVRAGPGAPGKATGIKDLEEEPFGYVNDEPVLTHTSSTKGRLNEMVPVVDQT